MFGIKFIKVPPITYLIQYKRGNVKREGAGLSFFYYAPTTNLVAVPMGSKDVPFIFPEVTADFQEVTIQGQITYRITDGKQIVQLLDFSLDASGRHYVSEDPEKLSQRIIDIVKVVVKKDIQRLQLKDAMRLYEALVQRVTEAMVKSEQLSSLGIEVLGFSILAVKPNPETARALEAETREELLKRADEAIYMRRNAAVEQERAIKENELNTEIAVEKKKREVKETEMAARVSLEQKNTELVKLAVENSKKEADAKAYGMTAMMKALGGADPKIVQAIVSGGMSPDQMIAMAFQEMAVNSEKIGELNISPELLRGLLKRNRYEKSDAEVK
jgi:regulator of protease activity HflC (stomatin/prohibitin superfamily)